MNVWLVSSASGHWQSVEPVISVVAVCVSESLALITASRLDAEFDSAYPTGEDPDTGAWVGTHDVDGPFEVLM